MVKYECKACNYKTTRLSNWRQHIKTDKHLRRSFICKNCGKKGESLFLNTPQCVHRASIPKKGNYRDVLFVTFAATPDKISDLFHYENLVFDVLHSRNVCFV